MPPEEMRNECMRGLVVGLQLIPRPPAHPPRFAPLAAAPLAGLPGKANQRFRFECRRPSAPASAGTGSGTAVDDLSIQNTAGFKEGLFTRNVPDSISRPTGRLE